MTDPAAASIPGASHSGEGVGEDDKACFTVHVTRTTLHLGAAHVDFVVHETDAPGLTFINVHDDEQTSVEASLEVIGRHGGRVIELQHGDVRNITFKLDGTVFEFDPNRMFTDDGARASLQTHGPCSDAAHRAVRAFAEEVIRLIDPAGKDVVITVHNTMSGQFSAKSYMPGGEYGPDAAAVVIHDAVDPLDFFFVTVNALHEGLSAAGFNSVLQDDAQARDDGSLSVYATRKQLPYVNCEARIGHLEAQIRMLLALRNILGDRAGF